MGKKKKKKNKPKQERAEPDVAEAAASSGEESEAPDDFTCPITQEILRDPVMVVRCGHTFERHDITSW